MSNNDQSDSSTPQTSPEVHAAEELQEKLRDGDEKIAAATSNLALKEAPLKDALGGINGGSHYPMPPDRFHRFYTPSWGMTHTLPRGRGREPLLYAVRPANIGEERQFDAQLIVGFKCEFDPAHHGEFNINLFELLPSPAVFP